MILVTGRNLIRSNRKSFTLIELLLVVIILGVIIGFSVPNFSKSYSNIVLSDTSSNLAYLMRYAQMRAIAERTIYRLNFDTDFRKYWLATEIDDDEFARFKGKIGKIFSVPEGLMLSCETNIINFYPDGKIDKTNIYLNNKNNKLYTISTEAQSGYVREFDYKK